MTPSQDIDSLITKLGGWRSDILKQFRALIHEMDPAIVEEWKWSTPVWCHNGQVCSFGSFNDHVKLNFFKGASLDDPSKQFNAGLEAKLSRGIDLYEGDLIDESGLKELIRVAVAFNNSKKK